MSKTEKAVNQMEAWAADAAHGYDQRYRWGEKGDFDCSASVILAWEKAGVPVKTNGATYTGNMRPVFLRCGFKDVTSSVNLSTGAGLKRGDVLLHASKHTAMYCGNGMTVEASINEHGGITGGTPGDQTGREFLKRSYRNFPWQYVLRYTAEENAAESVTDTSNAEEVCNVEVNQLRKGSKGAQVKAMQLLLIGYGYSCGFCGADGDFGNDTEKAVMRYQRNKNLASDGICGAKTWKKLIG